MRTLMTASPICQTTEVTTPSSISLRCVPEPGIPGTPGCILRRDGIYYVAEWIDPTDYNNDVHHKWGGSLLGTKEVTPTERAPSNPAIKSFLRMSSQTSSASPGRLKTASHPKLLNQGLKESDSRQAGLLWELLRRASCVLDASCMC